MKVRLIFMCAVCTEVCDDPILQSRQLRNRCMKYDISYFARCIQKAQCLIVYDKSKHIKYVI